MATVKTFVCLAVFLCSASLLSGCGGGDNPRIAVTPRFVPVKLAIDWLAVPAGVAVPTTTRAVTAPVETAAVRIRLTDLSVSPATENDLVTVATINRDPANRSAYRQNFVTPTVVARPNVSTYAEIQCLNSAGTVIASQKRLLEPLPASGDLGDFTVVAP